MKKKRTVSYFVAFILSLSMSVTFLGKDCKAEFNEESLISTTIIDVNVSELEKQLSLRGDRAMNVYRQK